MSDEPKLEYRRVTDAVTKIIDFMLTEKIDLTPSQAAVSLLVAHLLTLDGKLTGASPATKQQLMSEELYKIFASIMTSYAATMAKQLPPEEIN